MEKCYICNEEIKKTFLDKLIGTVIKIKREDKNQLVYACSSCQKTHKANLKKEIEKI